MGLICVLFLFSCHLDGFIWSHYINSTTVSLASKSFSVLKFKMQRYPYIAVVTLLLKRILGYQHLDCFMGRMILFWVFSKKIHQQFGFTLPVVIYLFKVSNRNSKTRCGTCSKLTIKTPEFLQ